MMMSKKPIDVPKNVWKSDKSWEPEKIWKFEKNWKFEKIWKFENLKIWKFENLKFKIAQVDPRDMLNKFCFHLPYRLEQSPISNSSLTHIAAYFGQVNQKQPPISISGL